MNQLDKLAEEYAVKHEQATLNIERLIDCYKAGFLAGVDLSALAAECTVRKFIYAIRKLEDLG